MILGSFHLPLLLMLTKWAVRRIILNRVSGISRWLQLPFWRECKSSSLVQHIIALRCSLAWRVFLYCKRVRDLWLREALLWKKHLFLLLSMLNNEIEVSTNLMRQSIAILLIDKRITAKIVCSIQLAANWVWLLMMLLMLHHKTSDLLLLAGCV